jgi:hypothetical protein
MTDSDRDYPSDVNWNIQFRLASDIIRRVLEGSVHFTTQPRTSKSSKIIEDSLRPSICSILNTHTLSLYLNHGRPPHSKRPTRNLRQRIPTRPKHPSTSPPNPCRQKNKRNNPKLKRTLAHRPQRWRFLHSVYAGNST